jgi:2-dehydropantoate 2-reductase
MRIAIFGSGGIGAYFGGRLAQAGEEVTFIARGAHLQAMLQNGLRVDSIKGDFHLQPVRATDDPHQVGAVDMILVCVKAWQVPEAAQAMLPMLGEETGAVYLGNGVEGAGQLSAVLGPQHVLGGLCQISTLLAGPGHVRHVGIDPAVFFGELDGTSSQRAENLRQAFARAGVNASIPADIQAAIWEKFVFIASISGVGAVTRCPVGVFRSLPATRQVLQNALQEIAQLGRARGVRLPEDIVARRLAFIDGVAPGVTASMQRDIMEGRPSELEAQNGAVVRMARQAGVPAPAHEFLYACLLPQELKARGELQFA